jgi:hypothetical protein
MRASLEHSLGCTARMPGTLGKICYQWRKRTADGSPNEHDGWHSPLAMAKLATKTSGVFCGGCMHWDATHPIVIRGFDQPARHRTNAPDAAEPHPIMARQSGRERRINQDEKKQPGMGMIVAGGVLGKG